MFRTFAAFAGRSRYRMGLWAAFAVLLWGVAASAAFADPAPQATPSPDAAATASPAPEPSPAGPAAAPPRTVSPNAAPARFGHLPVIDLIPIFTNPQFYTVPAITKTGQPSTNPLVNANTGYDNIDLGGTIKIPITPIFSASFDRLIEGTLNVPNARVTNDKNEYSYPLFSRDAVLVYRLDEQLKRLQVEEGLYFRHRIVGGANTSNNPFPPTTSSTEAHYGYAGLTYVTGGIPGLFGTFLTANINADTQAIDAHVGCGTAKTFTSGNFSVPCVNGVFDPNPSQSRVWETDQYVQLTVPVDKKHGFTVSAQDRWGAFNFYENAAFPYRWATSQTYLITKRFNRVFALTLRDRDQWSIPQGAPYVKPNAQHNGSIDILADFRVDTNNLH
jgi:hypothetical protein